MSQLSKSKVEHTLQPLQAQVHALATQLNALEGSSSATAATVTSLQAEADRRQAGYTSHSHSLAEGLDAVTQRCISLESEWGV